MGFCFSGVAVVVAVAPQSGFAYMFVAPVMRVMHMRITSSGIQFVDRLMVMLDFHAADYFVSLCVCMHA